MTDPGGPDRRSVGGTFDRIAEEFDRTRQHPWPEVERFVDRYARDSGVGVDLGSGNGRHAELLLSRGYRVLGVDASRRLTVLAADRLATAEFDFRPILGDVTGLPLSGSVADVGIYVATIHHISSSSARHHSLAELHRVLKPDAPAIVSAWSTADDRFERDKGFDTTIDWTLEDGGTVDRFYHIYDPNEFKSTLKESPLSVEEQFVSHGNCYAVVRRPSAK